MSFGKNNYSGGIIIVAIINADNNSLRKVLEENKDKPVLLNFWAPWCGPCRMFHPQLEQLASNYSNKLKVVKIDVDQNPDLAAQYGVMGIPHSRIIYNGNVGDSIVGFLPYAELEARLTVYIN